MQWRLPILRGLAVIVLSGLFVINAIPVRGQSVSTAPASHTASFPDESILTDPFVQTEGRRGIDRLYNMEFEEAERIFAEINRRYPDHPIGPFLEGLNIWWNHIMLNLSDTSHDEAFLATMDAVVERCDELLDEDGDSLDALFLKGAALGFRARLYSNRERWMKAVMDGRRAVSAVRKVGDLAPETPDYVFGKGMYDYYAAIIPEHYSFAKAVMFFLPDGDREQGLRQLEQAAENGQYIQTEAVYFLLQIHYLYENDYRKSREYATWLRGRHPDNPYFHSFEARVYARWGQWDQARKGFRSVLERYQQRQTGYNDYFAQQALYFLARDRMHAGAYDAAIDYLVKLEALTTDDSDDNPYRVLGRLRQGMAYDALGKRDAATQRYREVLELDDHDEAHDRAQEYLKEPYKG